MKTILSIIAGLLALTTFIYEDTELFPTKLGSRLFTYGQILITWYLWACGSTWKSSSLHMLGILASMNLDTTKPPPCSLWPPSSCMCISVRHYLDLQQRQAHQDNVSAIQQQPSTGSTCSWHQLGPHLFNMVEIIDTDDSSDEDHWPPNVLNEPYMVGNLVPIAGWLLMLGPWAPLYRPRFWLPVIIPFPKPWSHQKNFGLLLPNLTTGG